MQGYRNNNLTSAELQHYFWYDQTFRSTTRVEQLNETGKRHPVQGIHSHPALVANRFRESSLSPIART